MSHSASSPRILAPVARFLPPPAPAEPQADQPRTRTAVAPWRGLVSPESWECPSCQAQATRDQLGGLTVTHRAYCPTRRTQ